MEYLNYIYIYIYIYIGIITTEWKNEVQWRILIERLCSRLEERREEGVEEIEEMGDLFIHTALRIAGIVASGLNIDRVLEEQKAYDDVRISTRIFTDNSKQNKKIMQNFEEFWRCLVISLAEKDEDNETDLLLRVVWFVIVQSNSTCREQREFFTYLALLSQRELLKVIRAQNYFSAQSLSFAPNKAAQKFMKVYIYIYIFTLTDIYIYYLNYSANNQCKCDNYIYI